MKKKFEGQASPKKSSTPKKSTKKAAPKKGK